MYTVQEKRHTRAKRGWKEGWEETKGEREGGRDSGSRGREAKRKGAFLFSRLGAAPYRCVYQRPLPRGNVN